MRILSVILFILAFSPQIFAGLSKPDWVLKSGKLTYHVRYTLKNVVGTSQNVKGKGRCESGACQFLVAVPIKSFESGDGNRDSHMLEVTKAALNPMISVRVSFSEPSASGVVYAKADVSFSGKNHRYEHVLLDLKINDERASVSGQLPLILSDFEIERPSLFAVKINSSVPVDFELDWE